MRIHSPTTAADLRQLRKLREAFMATMIVHDTRLKGQTPLNYNYVLVVNQTKSIKHILLTVASFARRHRKLSLLHIFCHGYETNWNLGLQMCTPGAAGGFGLQLGAE